MKVGELVPTRNVTQCRERLVTGLKIQMKVGELVPTSVEKGKLLGCRMKYDELVPSRNDSLCRESSVTGHKIQRKRPSVTTVRSIESTKVYDSQKIIDVNYMRNTFSLIPRNELKVSIYLYNTF